MKKRVAKVAKKNFSIWYTVEEQYDPNSQKRLWCRYFTAKSFCVFSWLLKLLDTLYMRCEAICTAAAAKIYHHLLNHSMPRFPAMHESFLLPFFEPSSDISFWFFLWKSAFFKDFSDILTNNKFNNKIWGNYSNSILEFSHPNLPNYPHQHPLKNAAKVTGTDLKQNLSPVVLAGWERRGESLIEYF